MLKQYSCSIQPLDYLHSRTITVKSAGRYKEEESASVLSSPMPEETPSVCPSSCVALLYTSVAFATSSGRPIWSKSLEIRLLNLLSVVDQGSSLGIGPSDVMFSSTGSRQ